MSKNNPQELHQRIVEEIKRLWNTGNPVANRTEEMARIAIRRWKSSERRGVNQTNAKVRLRDLTNGLIAHFEKDITLVGPLRLDYEHIAEHLDRIFIEFKTG